MFATVLGLADQEKVEQPGRFDKQFRLEKRNCLRSVPIINSLTFLMRSLLGTRPRRTEVAPETLPQDGKGGRKEP